MKSFLITICIFISLIFSGCSKTQIQNLGDGKIDVTEAAEIRVAIGLAFSTRPDTIAPAYAVTQALLVILNNDISSVTIPYLEETLSDEVKKLQLDKVTQESMYDLIYLMKVNISQELIKLNIPEDSRLVVIKDIIKIINNSAAIRLGILK